MAADPDWQADLLRYPSRRPFLREQSIWAVWAYRFGRRIERQPAGPSRTLLNACYTLIYRPIETVTGISLPRSARIGPGLRIWHFGNIFIHPATVIGANCVLRQGVTIGNRTVDGGVPVIGDDVEFGAYAQVIGPVRIGHRCRIGAMSVVLDDMPDDSTAVGIPARIVPSRREAAAPLAAD